MSFVGFYDINGLFDFEIPVATGNNILTVVATDKSGNQTTAEVSVLAKLPALPQLTITSPENGQIFEQESISVSGTIRSSLPAEQIRLLFDGQVYFPVGSDGDYTFNFENVLLSVGNNNIQVTAETEYGSISDQVVVVHEDPDDPEEPGEPEEPEEFGPPSVEIFSPLPDAHLSTNDFQLSGTVNGDTSITSVLVNGQPANVTGSGKKVYFDAPLTFAGGQQLDISVTATDSNGESTTHAYAVYHDDGPPVITLINAQLQDIPQINTVVETPYVLKGTVTDENLGGFSINDNTVHLLPVDQGSYSFSVNLDLTRGQQSVFTLKAWDQAGNTSSRGLGFYLDSGLDITIISPRAQTELYTETDTVALDIALIVPGLKSDDSVTVSVGNQLVNGLTRTASGVHGLVSLNLADGEHTLTVGVVSSAGVTLAKTTRSFRVIDVRLIPLALIRQEPANNETGVKNNGFIGFYFNKSVDPSLLSVEVLETFHGMDYTSVPQGSDITSMSKVEMEEVHRDRELVAGSLSSFPAKTMVAFYPIRNFAFGATVYVKLSYNNKEIANTTFTVKPLPTFIQGFVADQFNDQIEGITVFLQELDRRTVTDKEGNYTFGFGDSAENIIPAGRYRAVANPGLSNNRFGSTEFWINVESGRLNEIAVQNIAVINNKEPFRYLSSGEAQVVLAAGELTLDLTDATLEFVDGKSSGNVHTQFMTVTEQPYGFIEAGAPQWVFNLNPNGIGVQGNVGVEIKMPAMVGSYEYIPHIGERVVLVGLDDRSLKIAPVGVGRVDVDLRMVISEGQTSFNRLNIIGYGFVDENNQQFLEAFSKGEISLNELINILSSGY